ncbi:FAD-dependent monooxygenase [Phytomonospora sp. NPDC050363]|uniref:FAD-dependent monooxygenase n=1 Tax=Phytomonospora sp. NPDC050363 TaxID=3155642 RepID=UPI0033DCD3B2
MKADVLVIGAGPTGLVAAAELRRHGASVLIADAAEPDERSGGGSRAVVLHARSLEVLEPLGVGTELARLGQRAHAVHLVAGPRRTAAIELHRLDTVHPYVLVLPQPQLEAALLDRLKDFEVGVLWGHHVEELTEEAAGISAVLNGSGGPVRVEARYAIDCGGAGSELAAGFGVTERNGMPAASAVLADVRVDGDFAPGVVTGYSAPDGAVLLLPYRDGHMRVSALDFTGTPPDPSAPPTLDDLQRTVDAIAPVQLRLSEPRWIGRYDTTPRLLDHYRAGRVFFAGDAAHRFAPTAGLGLNVGVQDAVNLAWKLAYVSRGLASDSLLHTYHAERHQAGEQTLRATEHLHRLLRRQSSSGFFRGLSGPIMRGLLSTATAQDRFGTLFSQLGVNYRHTPFSRSHREHGARAAGDRVPDLSMASMSDPDLRLYDLLRRPGYLLIGCVSRVQPRAEREAMADLFAQVRTAYDGLVHPYLLLSEGLPADGEVPVLVDTRRQFRTRMRAHVGDLLLIRPDGHLAFQLPRTGASLLPNLLGAWVVTHATTPALTPTHSVLG